MFAPTVVWAKWWGHSLSEAGGKQGKEVQAKFVPGGFFSGCTWKSTGGVHAVCMRGYDWEILGVKEARLSWTAIDCVLFFFSSTLSDERCSNLSFENPNPNPKNRTYTVEQSQRHRRYTRCVPWQVTMYGHLPFKKLGFLAVQMWPIFLLKYSLRRALLQLEFRWSKPDESHSEQSKTETRKTAFCSSKTLKSYALTVPAVAGCPVSNPDNNCANGLLPQCKSKLRLTFGGWLIISWMHCSTLTGCCKGIPGWFTKNKMSFD